ncbi:MAG: GDP-mannose 4,6-dehydratase [Acidobacteriaceae bacterium]|nr:GDP-mannose 4,6-dehydratase [Acidobacteriaceae bacterium]
MSTVLITGGAGFIGSHLAESCVSKGFRTLVIDDLSSGSVDNIAHLRNNTLLEFFPESILESAVLPELVDRADVIFHMAATVGVFNIIESPVATISNNIGGTEVVLERAAKKRKKVIVASTSEVYGKSTTLPFREDGDLVFGASSKFRWSYAASKLIDEFMALAYWRERRVPTVVTRFFNTIGPRQVGRYGMVVPRFLDQAIAGRSLTVYGTGKQSRCFTYVSDVVEWLLRLAGDDRAVGDVFNLGNPEEISIGELAQRVIALTASKSSIQYVPYEKAYEQGFEDMERRIPDIGKVKTLTNYAPRVSLDLALTHTRDWCKERARLSATAPAFSPALAFGD